MANAKIENHSHAWRGTWDRPIKIDEDLYHPFTIARMTDHNVRGRDAPEKESAVPEKSSNEASPNDKSKKGISYRSSEVGSGEEYYFYKQNRELIEDARKKRK